MGFGLSEYFTELSVLHALAGGALLGCSVVFKTSVLSGVCGISNYTKRMFKEPEVKRYFFMAGMILSGFLMSLTWGGFEHTPEVQGIEKWKLLARMVVGGFCVGLGASMQHGCTSGHGLTGLARLNFRSWVAVPTFMASGAITASLLATGHALPPDEAVEAAVPSWKAAAALAALGAGVLMLLGAGFAGATKNGNPKIVEYALYLGEFAVGMTFGAGLIISGMSRPSKVGGFLDVTSGEWDGSLMFVMGGALLITFPFFQMIERCGLQEKALLHYSNHDLPPTGNPVDLKLILGAIIFGAGWGICGMCPGPMWVNVGGHFNVEIMLAVAGLMAGLWADGGLAGLLKGREDEKVGPLVCVE